MFIYLPIVYITIMIIYYIKLSINMRLQQMKQGQYLLTIPSQLVRAKGWKKQDTIEASIDSNGDIVLKKK